MLTRARYGSTATFGLAGALCAVWTVRVPALADKLHLDAGQLGITVLAWGLGALVSMQVTGRLLARLGSRSVLRIVGPATAATLVLIGLAPTYLGLLVAAVVFGMTFAVLDIAMNAHAALVERAYGRPLMSGMHAGWSIGAVTGGLLGAATAYAGWSFTRAVVAFAVVGVPVALALGVSYLADPSSVRAGTTPSRVRLPRTVYLLGAIAFASFMIEGSIADWSGLYLRDTLQASEGLAALGYPVFETAMIIGRLGGDRVRTLVGDRRLLIVGGLATAGAAAFVVAAPGPGFALAAFAAVGFAVCTVVPVAFSLAGRLGPAAIARTNSIAYLGLLLGPTVIGPLADATSLRTGFVVAVVVAVALAVTARALPAGEAYGRDPAQLAVRVGALDEHAR
jgi:MFS family permease